MAYFVSIPRLAIITYHYVTTLIINFVGHAIMVSSVAESYSI